MKPRRLRVRSLVPVPLRAAAAASVGLVLAVPAGASDDAVVTDLSGTPAAAIESRDIADALAPARGTRIEPTAPPTVRLPIYFEHDSATLRRDARDLLEKVGAALTSEDLESFHFVIEGHTDSDGSEAYNDLLSERRAHAVAEYLAARGVSLERLETVGRGERAPVASNVSEEGRQRNRRVEVINRGAAR